MRRLIPVVAATFVVLLGALPAPVQAEMPPGEHANGGLGFHDLEAPIGLRWWLSGQKVGIDLGLGFRSLPAPSYDDENLTGWSVEVGVPLVIKSWSHMHLMFRPGILYTSQQVEATDPPDPFDTEDATTFDIAAEVEAEVFLIDHVSVSASHGIRYSSVDPAVGEERSSWNTFGNNFTNIGFHVYFLGGAP